MVKRSYLQFQSDFICNLHCDRCNYIKTNGQRCKNRVCVGAPLCWIHNKVTYGVQTKESTIPNSGKGLFALRNFPRGSWICPHGGEEIDQNCLDLRYPGDTLAPYAIEDNGTYMDAACERGIGSMANGIFGANNRPAPKREHNADLFEKPGEGIWIRATKNIARGQEIFVHYGHDYLLDDNFVTKRSTRDDNRPC